MGELTDAQAKLIDKATAASGSASLSDIQHVVILMQENRAFDHYFGTLSGVRGFSDPHVLSQFVGGNRHPVFDVPPVTAPPGTPGEYLTGTLPSAAEGIAGPVGLGFRTPCLVVSPFSRGGYVCSQTFDHTSLLRFIETRFGVEVPNLPAWRRSVTGDMTGGARARHMPRKTGWRLWAKASRPSR